MTMSRLVENDVIPGRRLGRRPHDPDRPVLRLAPALTGVTLTHPPTVDHLSKVTGWGTLGNDRYGDCGPAMVEHDRMLVTAYLAGAPIPPDVNAVYDLYRRSGNPNFPRDDNGVVLADMLSQVAKGGIGGTKCLAYAKVDVTNLDEVRAAIAIFGGLHLGVDMQIAQQAQTNAGGPWDYQPSGVWGGHAVLAGLYTSDSVVRHSDVSVVTWGMVLGTTDAFWARQVAEAWVVIWPEHLGSVAFQQGVDLAALAAAYKTLTGRVFPTVTPPVPPSGDAADRVLAAAVRPWVDQRHVGVNGAAARAVKAWLTAKGL